MAKEIIKEAANNVKRAVDVSPIREDLATLQEDAREAARVLADDARVLAKDVKSEGKRYYAQGREELAEGLEVAKERGKSQYAEIANFVQNNPGQSLAVAFVGGMIASLFLGRRR